VKNAARIAIVTAIVAPFLLAKGSVVQAATAQPHSAAQASEDRVDINTAIVDQLLKVPGMTRTWAARIIRFRPYRAKNDLLDRGVVTSEVYGRIKDHIIAHRQGR
jgi:competence protein ComEA